MPAMSAPVAFSSSSAAFFAGAKTALTSVFMLVLAGTYIGIGALTHDFGLSSWWLAISTVLVWAAPAQVILITTVTTGAAAVRDRPCGHPERGAVVSDGRRAHAGAAWTDNAPARPAAANTFHRGEHVG